MSSKLTAKQIKNICKYAVLMPAELLMTFVFSNCATDNIDSDKVLESPVVKNIKKLHNTKVTWIDDENKKQTTIFHDYWTYVLKYNPSAVESFTKEKDEEDDKKEQEE